MKITGENFTVRRLISSLLVSTPTIASFSSVETFLFHMYSIPSDTSAFQPSLRPLPNLSVSVSPPSTPIFGFHSPCSPTFSDTSTWPPRIRDCELRIEFATDPRPPAVSSTSALSPTQSR